MSESKKIADHDEALSLYFDEMLVESTIVTSKNSPISATVTPTRQHNEHKAFQALLFDINGLQLAIRTQEVKAILPWPETPLEHSTELSDNDAFMGANDQQIKVINTAKIVLPVEHQLNIAKPSFLIVISTGEWALSCHKINTITRFSDEEIRWRKNSGTRPWLAGTSIEKSCSIINVAELVHLMNSQKLA